MNWLFTHCRKGIDICIGLNQFSTTLKCNKALPLLSTPSDIVMPLINKINFNP